MKRLLTITLTALLALTCASSASAKAVPSGTTWLATNCKITGPRIASPTDARKPMQYKGTRCVIEPLNIDEIRTLGFRYRDAAGKQVTLHSAAAVWSFATQHGSKCRDVNASGCYVTRSFFTKRKAIVYHDGVSVDTIRFH